jgi:hypothetical protein
MREPMDEDDDSEEEYDDDSAEDENDEEEDPYDEVNLIRPLLPVSIANAALVSCC